MIRASFCQMEALCNHFTQTNVFVQMYRICCVEKSLHVSGYHNQVKVLQKKGIDAIDPYT